LPNFYNFETTKKCNFTKIFETERGDITRQQKRFSFRVSYV